MKAYVELLISGQCVEFPCIVNYDYSPEESATRTYPGCGESCMITGIEVAGVDVLGLEHSDEHDRILLECIEHEHGDDYDPREDEDFGLQTKRGDARNKRKDWFEAILAEREEESYLADQGDR